MPNSDGDRGGEHLGPALGEVEVAGGHGLLVDTRLAHRRARRTHRPGPGSTPSTSRPSAPSSPASSSASRAARRASARPRTRTSGTSSPHTASSTRHATSSAWPSAARSAQCRTAVRPSRMPCHVDSTSPPRALTAPVPVTTTWRASGSRRRHEGGLEEVGDGIHRGQAGPRVVGHGDAEAVLEAGDELQHRERVDLQVEAEVGRRCRRRRGTSGAATASSSRMTDRISERFMMPPRGDGGGRCAASAAGASRRGAVGSPSSR